jgi:hypothetical protein
LPPLPDHIPLHRLWMFATLQNDMLMHEHVHLVDCEECQAALRVCMSSENFGAALVELRPGGPGEEEFTLPGFESPLPAEPEGDGSADELIQAIVTLFRLAATKANLGEKVGNPSAIEYRVRATRALALFLPHEEARTGLTALMDSEDIPTEIRNVAAEALHNQESNDLKRL